MIFIELDKYIFQLHHLKGIDKILHKVKFVDGNYLSLSYDEFNKLLETLKKIDGVRWITI